jgi:hypothetical protein
MTPEEFNDCFDRFLTSAWRLEVRQLYASAGEAERIRAWREGQPRPERSVRTSPWLRRVAVTTADGKQWGRVHVVSHPLSEYLRYEMVGYVESAAAGEEIRIADRAASSALDDLGPDFWLFDSGTEHAFAVLMRYDDDGRLAEYEPVSTRTALAACCGIRDLVLAHSIPLNAYLAAAGADILGRVA